MIAATAFVQIVFGIYTSHKLAGPALKMRRTLDRAASGDFSVRVSFRRGDQLEELASSLNRMLERLGTDQTTARAELEALERCLDRVEESPGDEAATAALREHLTRIRRRRVVGAAA